MTYAIEDICLHRDYADPLRQELREQKATKNGSIDVEELPLLDSFLKESIRYSNADASKYTWSQFVTRPNELSSQLS